MVVGAIQVDGNWTRLIDQNGSRVEYDVSSAQFPTKESIEAYFAELQLQPVGYLFEDHSTDDVLPVIDVSEVRIVDSGITLSAHLLTNLISSTAEYGLVVSDSIMFDDFRQFVLQGNYKAGDAFEASFDLPIIGISSLYYRSFTRTHDSLIFGSTKKILLDQSAEVNRVSIFPNALDREHGWKENWFGLFRVFSNDWVYHSELGWIYAVHDEQGGIWIWERGEGWIWTNEQVWPYLYKSDSANWLYFLRRQDKPSIVFDYLTGSFFYLESQE